MKVQFVEFIPENIQEDILYISLEYKTATHLCPCGCMNRVVTPIGGDGWELIIHEDTIISLSPSIGNFRWPCKSHYFYRKNKIEWV